MKLIKTVRTLLVTLSTLGVLLPQAAVTRANDQVAVHRAVVQDLALQDGGAMRGQVVNENGRPEVDVLVTVSQDGETLASKKTDSQGRFTVVGLRGGIYVLSADNVSTIVRAWSPRTAPPAATSETLLVAGDSAVRGQFHLDHTCLAGLLVAGFVAGVAAVIIDHASGS